MINQKHNDLIFYKFQGAGNDFVLFENLSMPLSPKWVEKICHRNFGVGADGLMALGHSTKADFSMAYYNADGQPGSFCGNGARCIVAMAFQLGLIPNACIFEAYDGLHKAIIHEDGLVSVQMKDVLSIHSIPQGYMLDTGSPHLIRFVDKLSDINVFEEGKKWRTHDQFKPGGINVNFVESGIDGLKIATFERGVENETLACGTGITAAALVSSVDDKRQKNCSVPVLAKGGILQVDFQKDDSGKFTNIWLKGPAEFVFSGRLNPDLWKLT
jgi:diaminopimelate epimerase